MKKHIFCLFLVFLLQFPHALALEDLFAARDDFTAALDVSDFEGQTLTPEVIARIQSRCERLYVYAYLRRVSDLRNAEYEADLIAAEAAAARLLSLFGIDRAPDAADFSKDIASIALGEDFSPKSVTKPDGTAVSATYAELQSAIAGGDRAYAERMYNAYYQALGERRHILAATLRTYAETRIRAAKSANASAYDLAFAEVLNMPPHCGDALLNAVYANMDALTEKLRARAEKLGKTAILPYDGVADENRRFYSLGDAKKTIIAATATLGADYTAKLKAFFASGHIMSEPCDGKQSGAFCIAADGADPYISMSYRGSLSDLLTLAHEVGHAMNTILSREKQPAEYAAPNICVTEGAAVLNEMLVLKYLGLPVDGLISSTLFQQARFLTFERAVYSLSEQGVPLTANLADRLWAAIGVPYRGGVVTKTSVSDCAWAAVPHMYRDFYVASYSFALVAAEKLSRIAENDPAAVVAYLSAGCSRSDYDIFCGIGIDFCDEMVYNDVINIFRGES